jgi:hypothetical protein
MATHWTVMRGTLVAAVVELTHRQLGAATTHQLRRIGVSAKAQRTAERDGWLVRVEPGVVVLGASSDTWRRRLRVGLLALDGRAWVSHEAAAALYGWPGGPAQPVEFTVPREARGLRCAATVHTTDDVRPGDVRTVSGLRCSSPIRTLVDLARSAGPGARLQAAAEAAVRSGLVDRAELDGGRLAVQAAGATKSRSCSSAPTSSGRRSA